MDDLQLNISTVKKSNKKLSAAPKSASEYKFLSKPTLAGKTIARKRPKASQQVSISNKYDGEPNKKVPKTVQRSADNQPDFESTLRDLSENKGKFEGKSYEKQYDDNPGRRKSGGWISSLFKNNPDVPRVGQRAVKPIVEKVFAGKNFADLDIHPHSVANLQQNLGLKELMTVQQSAIPVILQGRDVLIRSQTGSGKTLAYALPIIEGLQAIRPKINRHDGIRVVVVVPTRELAVQTYELFVKLVKPFTWIVPGLLSGGQKRKAEKARLRKGLSILVGTPGRINDHLRHTKSINFCKTNCLVLDEADRLLDMGYEKDVAAIVKAIEDHKKAATYDPMALVKTTFNKKNTSDKDNDDERKKHEEIITKEPEEVETKEPGENGTKTDLKHHLTEILLSKERQTILLSATLTKAVESLAGITLMDPVFVDTSEGRAVVADSLKPQSELHLKKKQESTVTKINEKKQEEKKEIEDKLILKVEELIMEVTDEKEESKGRLKAFTGIKLLLSNHNEIKETTPIMPKQNIVTTAEESDSDSDYEYFKVQKELETKNKIKIKVEEVNEEEIKPSPVGNTFQEALKSAIIEDELVLPATVNQTFLVIPMKLRLVTLCSLIIEHCVNMKNGKMIVFMATLEMVDYHAELIEEVLTGKSQDSKKKKKGNSDEGDSSSDEDKIDYELPAEGAIAPVAINVFSLHGSMPHEQRMHVFKMFRAARNGVLICTDVAARGLDVPHVDLVLQYCVPTSATDYVHRVGRTGRATRVGAAVMFLLPSEVEFVRYLEQKRIRLRQKNESNCFESLRTIVPSAPSGHKAAIAVQAKLEHVAHSSKEWVARASRAYTTWVSFYSGYPREVRPYLDSKQLHLGHAAKSFALRDTPGALGRRAKNDPMLKKEKPQNRLSVKEDEEKKRIGFSKMKLAALKGRPNMSKQSSMHTASEFDSGLPPIEQHSKKKKQS